MKNFIFRQSIVSATLLLVFTSAVSKVLGLLREILVAKYYGVSSTYDIYLIALAIPTLLASSLSYTLPNQIIPTFLSLRTRTGENNAWRDIWKLGNLWALGVFLVSLLLVVTASGLVSFLAPNLQPIQHAEATHLLRILALIVFVSYVGKFWESLLNADRNFFFSALAPILYSLTLIGSLFFLNKLLGIEALAYGVILGTLIQSIIMSVVFIQHRSNYSFSFDFQLPLLLPVTHSAAYIFAVEALSQALTIIDRIVAGWYKVPEGSISALNYANLIYALPIAVVAISLIQVIFPVLASYTAKQDTAGMVTTLSRCIRLLIFVLVPISIVLIILSRSVIILFYKRGAFDSQAVDMTATCLSYLSIGILAASISALLMRVFYSLNLSKALLRGMIILFALKVILALCLGRMFSYQGLALSTTITWYVAALLLGYMLYKHIGRIDARRIFRTCANASISGIIAGVVCFVTSTQLMSQNNPGIIEMVAQLLSSGGLACLAYLIVGLILRMEESIYLAKIVIVTLNRTRAIFQS